MTEKSHQPSRRQTDAAQHGGGRRFLLDFGPLLLFFVANYLYKDLIPVSYTHLTLPTNREV